LLARAVIAVVREWVYQPACLNGSPVAIEYYFIVVKFRLKDGVTVEGQTRPDGFRQDVVNSSI